MAAKADKGKAVRRILIGFLALILVCSAVSMLFAKKFYDKNFPRYDEPRYSGYLQYDDVAGDYARSIVKFPSGRNTLTGYIYGEENQKGLVVIAAGRGEGAEGYLAETLYFVDKGWRVLSFDYTGVYESEGENSVGLPQALADLKAALDYIADNDALAQLPIMLYGHSWGGYAVTAILGYNHNISAVASIAGFNTPMGLLAEYTRSQLGAFGTVAYPFLWAYQAARFGGNAWVSAVSGINGTDIPVMVIHGDVDDSIAYDGASIIAQRLTITNPNVVYKTCSAENRNDHDHLYRSEAAMKYIDAKNQEFKPIYDRYHGKVPDSVLAEFHAGVDHFRTSELDADLMNAINRFFESSVPSVR